MKYYRSPIVVAVFFIFGVLCFSIRQEAQSRAPNAFFVNPTRSYKTKFKKLAVKKVAALSGTSTYVLRTSASVNDSAWAPAPAVPQADTSFWGQTKPDLVGELVEEVTFVKSAWSNFRELVFDRLELNDQARNEIQISRERTEE